MIAARDVAVESDDTVTTLQDRVQEAERDLLVETLARIVKDPQLLAGAGLGGLEDESKNCRESDDDDQSADRGGR